MLSLKAQTEHFWLGGSEGEEVKNGVILSFRGTVGDEDPPPATVRIPAMKQKSGPRVFIQTPGFTRHALSDLKVVSPVEAIAEDAAGNLWFGGDNLPPPV